MAVRSFHAEDEKQARGVSEPMAEGLENVEVVRSDGGARGQAAITG